MGRKKGSKDKRPRWRKSIFVGGIESVQRVLKSMTKANPKIEFRPSQIRGGAGSPGRGMWELQEREKR